MIIRIVILLSLAGGWAAAAAAQTNTAWPAAERPLANSLSNLAVGATIGADIIQSLRLGIMEEKVLPALGCEGLKYGVANGAALLIKHYVHEQRPDGSDVQSFPSQHTANAAAATGWAWAGSWSVAFGTGYLRTAANRHWWQDVAVGAAIGGLAHYGVGLIPACRGLV